MLELCEFGTWRGLPLYKCVLCPYSTLDREDFMEHVETRHMGPGYNTAVIYRCQACDFETEDEERMQLHVRQTHRKLPEPPVAKDRFGNSVTAAGTETQEVADNGTSDTDEDDD